MGLVEGVRVMPKAVLPCNGPSKSQLSMHNTKRREERKGSGMPRKVQRRVHRHRTQGMPLMGLKAESLLDIVYAVELFPSK